MKHEDHPTDPPTANDDGFAKLISTAGRRETPPDYAYEQTLRVATEAWEKKVRARRWRLASSLAASIALIASLGVWQITREPVTIGTPSIVATLDRTLGTLERRTSEREWEVMSESSARTIAAETHLRTRADASAGLLLQGGQSLRLAGATEVVLQSSSKVRLITGKAYMDTGNALNRSVELLTEAGTAIDIGTQFEVFYRDQRFRLRVRDGTVMLQRGNDEIHSTAGEQLAIGPDGAVKRTFVELADPDWQWAEALAPTPEIEGRPLSTLLDWVRRETGRSILYADREIQRRTEHTILHGSIEGLAPLDALRVMLATTDFDYRLGENGSIRIELRQPQ
jgi:ferric-dicitrate binding protein FerR (iron transport regulator)